MKLGINERNMLFKLFVLFRGRRSGGGSRGNHEARNK